VDSSLCSPAPRLAAETDGDRGARQSVRGSRRFNLDLSWGAKRTPVAKAGISSRLRHDPEAGDFEEVNRRRFLHCTYFRKSSVTRTAVLRIPGAHFDGHRRPFGKGWLIG
jgi:hypothetical protein